MTVQEVAEKFDKLIQQGHSQAVVLLDTNPHALFAIGEIDVEPEGDRVIIWKA